jgi:hypothetical protein
VLEETIAALHAPLHPNCYLSPTQFAEKFGQPLPGTTALEPEQEESGGNKAMAENGSNYAVPQDAREKNGATEPPLPNLPQSRTTPMLETTRRPTWLERAFWLAAIVLSAVAAFFAGRQYS